MALLFLYWGIMIACYLAASRLRSKAGGFGFVEKLLNIMICILVFIMGLRMGANEEVTSSLASIGLQSVVITIFTVGGSMLAVTAARKAAGLNREGIPYAVADAETEIKKMAETEDDEESSHGSSMKFTALIVAFVVVGMVLGYLLIPILFESTDKFQDMSGDWLVIGICILLGIVGFNLGLQGNILDSFKGMGIKVILVPLAGVAGSLIAGVVYGLISSLSIREGIAVSAGFGWYTLAPGMITEAGFAMAGAISFMHNVIRETLGIVIIPLAAQKIGYLEATAIPGVAAMDVCLPIVEKSCRRETVVYSLVTGAMMAVAVTVVVPLVVGG